MKVLIGLIGLVVICVIVLFMGTAYVLAWFVSRPLLLLGWQVLITQEEVTAALSNHEWKTIPEVVEEIRVERLKNQSRALILFEMTETSILLQASVRRGTAEMRTGEEHVCPRCSGTHARVEFRHKGQRSPNRKRLRLSDLLDFHRPVWA